MASGFFGYDPYGYDPYYDYYAIPYDAYYRRQPAPARRSRGVNSTAPKSAPEARDTKTSFSIPIHGPDSDPEPERKPKAKAAPAVARAEPVAPVMSTEEATLRIQAATRGLLARKTVRAVCEVEREAEQVRAKMASGAEALLADPRARVAVGEALMRMLLRLDAVRGAREYRRRIIKRVLALQDAVDGLETKPAPATKSSAPAAAPMGEEAEADALETAAAVEMAEESAVAPEVPDAMHHDSEVESIKVAVHTPTQIEVNEAAVAGGEPEAEEEPANFDVDEPEGDWEMVPEEKEHTSPVAATPDDDQEPPRTELACPLETMTAASVGAASDGVDMTKVMQMVAALCEQNAQQCAVIGALAERVDALERTVRRMEDAESCRRRAH